ncbi:MAG TPA: TIM-barrel domain-containing protein [Vicinamibacteria bacterium]|nr:TIM-barrel domain-containing protein [Vicinamibacteria bacterium]
MDDPRRRLAAAALTLATSTLAASAEARAPALPAVEELAFTTASGRSVIHVGRRTLDGSWSAEKRIDGRTVRVSLGPDGAHGVLRMSARPADGIRDWSVALSARDGERFTGVMERVVDGPQAASWEPGLQAALDLRGQRVDVILKPTTSVYAPFYLSSRGYGLFVRGDWPGVLDFAARDPRRVEVRWEGPSFEARVYRGTPADVVRAHALDAGPPFLPPRWAFGPWRWRDEHTQRTAYYDGTPVTGPFNADVMEDVLMMDAFGVPCSVYWIDRPWGPGRLGYDDFAIDEARLPRFEAMVRWLGGRATKTVLWIAPFFQGRMEQEALAKRYTLPGQKPYRNNYPMVDLTNPPARAYWQEGVGRLLKMGVAGFKLDRAEEDIPDDGPQRVHDGRSLRENRNAYPPMYVKAAYEVARRERGDDFALMPRAAYTGSAPYGVFWGGDVAGTQEGLRASIVAVQRAAVMGYPVWGSDTCGYGARAPMEQEVCGRWLAFSAFTPIMEVGPTRNAGFWNLPREPAYDAELIALWRLYARLHDRLADYSLAQARVATQTGVPIVRPLFLVAPEAPEAWTHWQTYLYGPDLVVSPVWEKGRRAQDVYLPPGARWRDAWSGTVHEGGRVVTAQAEPHQIPLFVRDGVDLPIGDLEREYAESRSIAARRPDLAPRDAEVAAWLARQ